MYQVNISTIQDDTLVVELPGKIKVIFPLDGDIDCNQMNHKLGQIKKLIEYNLLY